MARKFVVLKDFKDLQDNDHVYRAGHFYPREGVELDEDRAEELASKNNARNEQLIIEVLVKEDPKKEDPPAEKKTKKTTTKTKAKK